MKEILRIQHGMQDDFIISRLMDYNLSVYSGDIIYIQGLSGNGIKALLALLSGECPLKSGKIYLHEKWVENLDRAALEENRIYVITAERDLVNDLTVAENLEAIRKVSFWGKQYKSRKVEKQVTGYLRSRGLDISGKEPLWQLGTADKIKLSILKAEMHGAKLIVLDTTKDIYEGRTMEELCLLIQNLNKEGITFLILAECFHAYAEIATKIQLLHKGRDLKEWDKLTEQIRQRLRYQTREISTNIKSIKSGREYNFTGLFDYDWDMGRDIWEYLRTVKENNPKVWEEYFNVPIPEDKKGYENQVLVIPKDSAELLLTNLTIRDNIILPIPKRISNSRYGVIRSRRKENIAMEFYRMEGLGEEKYINELNRVQKKILSIYRFAVEKPKVIFLDNPYAGMSIEEIFHMRVYLEILSKRGSKIVYFAKSIDEMKDDCGLILTTQNGRMTKLPTQITGYSTF